MDKGVVIFGAGKLFDEREKLICDRYKILAIVDNNADNVKKERLTYNVLYPEALSDLPELMIIVSSDDVVDIVLQISSIIGEAECEKRVRFARFLFPITECEKEVSKANIDLGICNDTVIAKINGVETVELVRGSKYYKDIYRVVSKLNNPMISNIMRMQLNPADRLFGTSRGKAIDRYYIEAFLDKYARCIKGRCLEIADNTYTIQFGADRVFKSEILHVEGWGDNAIKGNFETGDGIIENAYDSLIITQTFMFINDVYSAAKNIYKALDYGGVALITVSGISKISRYDDDNWGMYHSFFKKGLEKIFGSVFGNENTEIIHYGNAKIAIAFLYGLTVEELTKEDLDYVDKDYPVIYGVAVFKR